jgi:hypothetical protein
MKISYLLVAIMGFTLSGCSSISSVQPVNKQVQNSSKTAPPIQKCHRNPMEVSFYTNGVNPSNPYTVVGNASVSQYNMAGNKRQEATIHDAMRSAAASMGGDAVINLKRNDATVSGTVIAYQPKITV